MTRFLGVIGPRVGGEKYGPGDGEQHVTMRAIRQHIHGSLLSMDNGHALLLEDAKPASETSLSLYLRFALVTLGTELPVLPASVLDDWGGEIKGVELFRWVREFGDQFPRAELFGFDLSGRETQYFLRELDLVGRLPCYAYGAKDAPLSAGRLVEAILLPDPMASDPRKIGRPSELKRPLRSAKVSWWYVNPSLAVLPSF